MLTPLLPEERPLLQVNHHWAKLLLMARLPALLALIVIVFLASAGWWLERLEVYVAEPLGWPNLLTNVRLLDFRLAISLLLLSIAGFWLIGIWVRWHATTVTLTSQRFIHDYTLWPRISQVIGMDRINDVTLVQSSAGRVLGYGRIKINGGAVDVDFLPQAYAFSEEIFVHAKLGPKPAKAEAEEQAAVISDSRDRGQQA